MEASTVLPLALCIVSVAVLAAPTFISLVSDVLTRRRRDFSFIPNRPRHIVSALLRSGLVVGAYALASAAGGGAEGLFLQFLALALGIVVIVVSVSDRRLYVEAATGLVTWRKISWPFWWDRTRVQYLDAVGALSYEDDHYFHLFNLAKLERYWTVNYNGSVSSSGQYSVKTLKRMAERFNAYRRAFLRHDCDRARQRRRQFRDSYEGSLRPVRDARAKAVAAEKARDAGKQRRAESRARQRLIDRAAQLSEEADSKFA
jgi:hypothetical protein